MDSFFQILSVSISKRLSISVNPTGKLFLQDGDRSQNSKKAKTALDEVGSRQFSIPPRSPDLNPIENIFNLVKAKLREDAFDKKSRRRSLQTLLKG